MTNSVGGRGCRSKSHWRDKWEIYDSLPREVRDKLKIARSNLCVGCIRNKLRRDGLEAVLKELDFQRRLCREKRGREIVLYLEPDLKG